MHVCTGVGALYVRRRPRVRLEPLQSGGGQERGLRSGTVPTPLAVGLGAACSIAQQEMEVKPTIIPWKVNDIWWRILTPGVYVCAWASSTIIRECPCWQIAWSKRSCLQYQTLSWTETRISVTLVHTHTHTHSYKLHVYGVQLLLPRLSLQLSNMSNRFCWAV